jgi:hypothetical protein
MFPNSSPYQTMFAYSVLSSHFRGTTTINAGVNANRRYYPPPNASPIDEQTCFMIRNNEWVSVTKVPPQVTRQIRMAERKYCTLYIMTWVFVLIVHLRGVVGSYHRTSFEAVTTALVPLHVASDAECLAASLVRAFEWLLAGV